MKTFTTRLFILALAGGLGNVVLARAADNAPPVDDSQSPYAKEIRQLKERMGWRQKTAQSFTSDFQQLGEVILHEGTPARERTELPAPAIVLRDGTVLAGQITATSDTVQFIRAGVTNEFSIHGLAALPFRPVAAQVAFQPAIAPTTGVVMNDRDWLEGEVREFTPQGIVLGTVLFGAKTVRWSDHPAAVVLGGRTGHASWELILKDGSQIRAQDFSIQGERGTARTTAVVEFPFALSELLEIRAPKP